MDLANLNAFIAIAETGSFSGAAEHPEQTLGHRLEQQVSDIVAQAVIDNLA